MNRTWNTWGAIARCILYLAKSARARQEASTLKCVPECRWVAYPKRDAW